MKAAVVSRCPHCQSHDVRALATADDGVTAYRCHECQRTFTAPPELIRETPAFAEPEQRKKKRR